MQSSGEYSLTELFQSIKQNTDKPYAGNVHAFRLDRFMEAKQKQNFDTDVEVADLIQHPIAVTLSRQAMFLDMCRYDGGVRERMRNGFKILVIFMRTFYEGTMLIRTTWPLQIDSMPLHHGKRKSLLGRLRVRDSYPIIATSDTLKLLQFCRAWHDWCN